MAKISNKNIKEGENPFGETGSVSKPKSTGKSLAELGGKNGNINDLGLNSGSLPTPSDAPDTPSVEDGSRVSNKAKIGSLKGSTRSTPSKGNVPTKGTNPFAKSEPKETDSEEEVSESSMTFAEMLEAMQYAKESDNCFTASHKIQKEDDNMEDDFAGGFGDDAGTDGADGAINSGDGGEAQDISVTKEFLLKLLSATMGKTFDETQLNLIIDTIASSSTGATLDVSDIPEIMEKLKAAAGDEGSEEGVAPEDGDEITAVDAPETGAGEGGEENGEEEPEDDDDGFGGKTKLIDSCEKESLEEGVVGVFGIKPVIRNMNQWNNLETNPDDDEETAMIRAMKKRAGLKYWN